MPAEIADHRKPEARVEHLSADLLTYLNCRQVLQAACLVLFLTGLQKGYLINPHPQILIRSGRACQAR